MIAVITTILFGIPVVIFAFNLGVTKGRMRERLKTPRPVQPTCPCGHSIGEHKEHGSCQSAIRRPHYNSLGSRSGHQWVRCACTKYYGPKPVEDFFHQGTFFPEVSS